MADLGQSFSPFAQGQGGGGANGAFDPVQEVIKLLSLRVPRNVGSGGIAPNQLLQPRAQGQGLGQQLDTGLGQQLGNGIAENWLRALFSGQGMPSGSGAAPGGGGVGPAPSALGRLPASVTPGGGPPGGSGGGDPRPTLPEPPIVPNSPAQPQNPSPSPWQQGPGTMRYDDPFRVPGAGFGRRT